MASNGKPEDAAGGGADGFGVPGADGSGQGEDAVGAEGLGGAKNGAQVAGVLEAGQHHDQRRIVPDAVEQVRPGPVGRFDERGDRLRRFGGQGGVQEFLGQQQNFGLRRQGQRFKQLFKTLRGKDASHAQAGPQGLFDQVRPFDSGQAAPLRPRPGAASARRSSLRRAFCLLCTMRTGIGRRTIRS